jgi:hypothetical protein
MSESQPQFDADTLTIIARSVDRVMDTFEQEIRTLRTQLDAAPIMHRNAALSLFGKDVSTKIMQRFLSVSQEMMKEMNTVLLAKLGGRQ